MKSHKFLGRSRNIFRKGKKNSPPPAVSKHFHAKIEWKENVVEILTKAMFIVGGAH